jgi:hypothetical protein
MSESYKRISESDTVFLETFVVAPWENPAFQKPPAKTRQKNFTDMTKEEKIEVVDRLIDYLKTH